MVDLTLPDVVPAQDPADASERLVARVLAWQHRHPLARRIGPGEVSGLGLIALPYGSGEAGQGATPLFKEPSLLPGLSHRVLAGFAARHGVVQRPAPGGWPQRDVERADGVPEPAPQTRYLLTAAIADPRSAMPRRLLLAPAGTAVWGRRPLDPVRVGAAGALAVVLLGLAAWGLASVPGPDAAAPPAARQLPPPPVAASVPAGRPPAASTPAVAPASVTVPVPASVPPPQLLPMPNPTAAAAVGATAASTPTLPLPAPTAAPAPAGPHFALVSMPSKKRADAQATLQRVRKVLGPAIGTLQIQVMPSPPGFVVTLWPLPSQTDAERMSEVLARRGVPMKWMEF